MNYLAHILLSGTDDKLRLGNFIGDAVKGSAYKNYPPAIADGIVLHRAIDSYTDNHQAVRELRNSLRPRFGRYSGILIDIYFDYLLASRFGEFSDVSLKRFTGKFYLTMVRNRRWLPGNIRRFMWHFIFTDRLGQYASLKGIRQSLDIMVQVHDLQLDTDEAVAYIEEHEENLHAVFKPFFTELHSFCDGYLNSPDRPEYLRTIGRG